MAVTGWRFLAVRALSGEVLSWDLPFTGVEFTRVLNASPSLRGHIDPAAKADVLTQVHTDGLPILDMWSTVVFAEDPSGTIRFGGLLVQPTRQGSRLSIECTGYFGWLARQLYLDVPRHYIGGNFSDPVGGGAEFSGVVRTLVDWVQSAPDADLGIVVDGVTSSPIRVGTEDEPYDLTPWEHPEIAATITDLATGQPGFDFVESHEWANPSDPEDPAITHRLTLHYPRAGRRRTDIRFETGVNISADEPEATDGDEYGNTTVADGAGEGSKALREVFPVRDGRPRVMRSVDAQHVTSSQRLRSIARADATAHASMERVPSIEVIDHPSARLGSWSVGDDVFVVIDNEWRRHEGWHRIVSDAWRPDEPNVARLELEPAQSFIYGGATGG